MKSRIKLHFCRPTTIKVSYKFKKKDLYGNVLSPEAKWKFVDQTKILTLKLHPGK